MTVPPSGPPGPPGPPGPSAWGDGSYQPPQYGPPPPQYGHPPYGQYGQQQSQYAQPPYGQYAPPPYGQPYAPPPERNKTPIVVSIAVAVVIALGLTLFFTLRGDDTKGTAGGASRIPTAAGSGTATSGGANASSASASASVDVAELRAEVSTLYLGLTSAYKDAVVAKSAAPIGTYIAAHNNRALGYSPAACNGVQTDVTNSVVYSPDLSSLRADPSFTRITSGRYAGRSVVGTAYALSLTLQAAKGQTFHNRVHVALGSDGAVTFFFECE